MADFRHIWKGVEIPEPTNWNELEIAYDFINRTEEAQINIKELEFAGDIATSIRNRIFDGLQGGLGVFEGDEYNIEVGEPQNPVYTFKGYLDYTTVEVIGCNKISVALNKRQGVDWLNDVADGFSFRYLQDKGNIGSPDFVKVPYVINYIPDNMQLIILSMSLFMMTKELVENIRGVAESVGNITSASTPTVGTSVGLGAGVVTAWDLGDIIYASLDLAGKIAYGIAIVIAIKNLIEQLIEELMPKLRYHLGMRLKTLFEKGCEHLGMTLNSSLLNDLKDWVVIPSKGHRGGEKPTGFKGTWKETGVPDKNDGMDTFGDLIRTWMRAFNADYKIENGVFHFERKDHWDNVGNYVLSDVFTNQNTLEDHYKLNTKEIKANYNIHWALDTQDQNTLDNQNGRVFQAITEPKIKTNKDMLGLQGLEEIGIGCSLGTRKNELTKIEEVLKGVATFIDGLTGIFGNGTSYSTKIEGRKGALLLSSHFTTVPKMVVMSGGKLAKDQREKLSAKNLWNKYHYINSLAEVNGDHNQYKLYDDVKVPFCMKDFVHLTQSNGFKLPDGREGKIELLKWKVWQNEATVSYRIKEKYTDNLKLRYVS